MRIQGRQLRASNLAERRVLKSLGTDVLRVPRKLNPFAVARHIRKIAVRHRRQPARAPRCAGEGPGEACSPVWAPAPSADVPDMPVVPTLPDSTSEPREAVAA